MIRFVTPTQLLAICPNLGTEAALWAEALGVAMGYGGILTKQQQASFIAQVVHESGGFKHLVENLNYSAEGLLRTFPKYFTAEEAATYARKPERIANRVYARRMGNGNEASGDGWKYRGRGLLQLTGKANYEAFFKDYLGPGMQTNPNEVADGDLSTCSAAWFWRTHSLNTLADNNDQRGICKAINGGYNGLAERLELYQIAIDVLEKS